MPHRLGAPVVEPKLAYPATLPSGPSHSARTRNAHDHAAPGPPQHRHHRPRRPRQDDAGRQAARAGGHVRRAPARRRAHDGHQRPRARARHHDPRQELRDRLRRTRASTSSTRPATPTSAARSSACSAWSTACCCSSTPSRARCRRRASSRGRRSQLGLKPIVVVNKVDRPGARAGLGRQPDVRPVRQARRDRRRSSTSRSSTPRR